MWHKKNNGMQICSESVVEKKQQGGTMLNAKNKTQKSYNHVYSAKQNKRA